MSVIATDENSAKLLRLIATYGGLADELNQVTVNSNASDAEAKTSDGTTITGLGTVCQHIASLTPAAAQLLGTTPDQQAKIAEWISHCRSELKPLMDDKLLELNNSLLTRTVLVGNTISLADLCVYATVSSAAVTFPAAQHAHFCNLLRWYDYVHSVADKRSIFPAASFLKPKLVIPTPPAPQPKADKSKPAAAAADGTSAATAKAAPTPAAANGDATTAAPNKKADKKADKKAKKAAAAGGPDTPAQSTAATPATSSSTTATNTASDEVTPDLLDLRVGTIVSVGNHPNADALYVEEIDLGEAAPRQIVSGLRKFVPLEQMQNRRVVVVCNLKPAKMRDVLSSGMVLCASNDAHDVVQPITPPEGVPNGERIKFAGYEKEPEALLNPKKKQFEKIAPELKTNADGVCCFKDIPFMTSQGAVTGAVPNAAIK